MFCDNCGTRVEDGQPFCPNCGKRMGGAAANASPRASYASRPVARPSSSGGLLGKFNDMTGLEKIFFPIVLGLWVVCLILTMLHTNKFGGSYFQWSPLLGIVAIASFTLAITFIVLDYFDWFNFKWLWLCNLIFAVVVLIVFAAVWGDSYGGLTAGGVIFFILQIGLCACSALLMIEKMKK